MLLFLHTIAFLIHLVSFIGTFFFHVKEADVDVLQPRPIHRKMYDSKVNQSSHKEFATDKAFSLNSIVLITWNEGLTCFSHFVALVYLYWFAIKDKKRVNELELNRRTTEYIITAFLLQVALVASVGNLFLSDIFFLFFINLVIQLLGVSVDMARQVRGDIRYGIFWYFVMAFLLLLSEIIYVLGYSFNVRSPTDNFYFYFSGIVYSVLYICFGLVKVYIKNESVANRAYVILSVTTKVVLSWILILNVHRVFEIAYMDAPQLLPAGVQDFGSWEEVIVILSFALSLLVPLFLLAFMEVKEEAPAAELQELCVRNDLKVN